MSASDPAYAAPSARCVPAEVDSLRERLRLQRLASQRLEDRIEELERSLAIATRESLDLTVDLSRIARLLAEAQRIALSPPPAQPREAAHG